MWYESVFAFLGNPSVRAVLVSFGRALFGWLENAFEDGKISKLEWSKLLETLMRMLPQAFALGAAGVPELSVLTDMGLVKLKKLTK